MFVDYVEDGILFVIGRFCEKDGYGKVECICIQKIVCGIGSGWRIMEVIEFEVKFCGLIILKLGV